MIGEYTLQCRLPNHNYRYVSRSTSSMAARGECSNLISIKQFKKEFMEFLEPAQYERKNFEIDLTQMAKEMDVPMDVVTDLSEVCRYFQVTTSTIKIILYI